MKREKLASVRTLTREKEKKERRHIEQAITEKGHSAV